MRSASPSETVRQTKLVRRADPSRPYDWFGERSTIQHSDEFFAAKDEHLLSRLAMVIDESQLFTVTLARSDFGASTPGSVGPAPRLSSGSSR